MTFFGRRLAQIGWIKK